jgi:3'-phosphoadenosine 5'-phosphosulfate sulfotransferase (PAPS reductase)/FAD synthetase
MKRVINFSGGKTSAYMTILEYTSGDIVLFADTGREHPLTYKFIDDFERNENIPVTRVSFPGMFDGFLQKRNYKRLPNRMMRTCTEELKVKTCKRFLKAQGILRYENLIGFRADEQRRVLSHKEKFKKVKTLFPLNQRGITKEMVNEYWSKKSYNLDIPHILGNCDLCFMKGKDAIITILSQYPELADKWIKDEEESAKQFGHTYLPGTTIKALRGIAQSNLFDVSKEMAQDRLNKIEAAFSCACTT